MTTFSIVQDVWTINTQDPPVSLTGVTAGNLLVAKFNQWRGSNTVDHSISDSNGGTWTKVSGLDSEMANSSYRHSMSIWVREADATDASSGVTITAVGPSNNSCALSVSECAASGSYTWTFEDDAAATSGTADWDGTSSGSTSSVSGSDLFEMAVGFGRSSSGTDPTAAGLFFTTQTDDKSAQTSTGITSHVTAIEASGQAGGAKSATINEDGSGYPGITVVLVFSGGAGGSDTDVSAASKSLSLTTNAASVAFDVGVSAASDALTLTTHAATVAYGVNIAANAEALTVSTYTATITEDIGVSATTGNLTLTTNAAAVSFDVNVSAATDALTVTTYPASLSQATEIAAQTASLSLTAYPAAITYDVAVEATTAALSVSTYAATIVQSGAIAAQTASLSLTTQPATVSLDVGVSAGADSLTLTTNAATIEYGVDVSAAVEALSLVTNAATIGFDANIQAAADALNITTYAASIASAAAADLATAGKRVVRFAPESRVVRFAPELRSVRFAPESRSVRIRR